MKASVAVSKVQRPPPSELPSSSANSTEPAAAHCAPNAETTFVVTADTHFGFGVNERGPRADPAGIEATNQRAIRAMNEIEGHAWPHGLAGKVGRPRGVLVAGDLTENGEPWQWEQFVRYFGLNGHDGLVNLPTYEGHGNHDKHHSWYVLDRIRERHGGAWWYAWDWCNVHLICLGEAPDDEGFRWLSEDLRRVDPQRSIVVYLHFPLLGAFADNNWFASSGGRERLARTLAGHRVVGLFHGHYHATGRYRWEGFDVYNVGSAKHQWHSFAVVRVTATGFRVASYDYDARSWSWWDDKPLTSIAPGIALRGTAQTTGQTPSSIPSGIGETKATFPGPGVPIPWRND